MSKETGVLPYFNVSMLSSRTTYLRLLSAWHSPHPATDSICRVVSHMATISSPGQALQGDPHDAPTLHMSPDDSGERLPLFYWWALAAWNKTRGSARVDLMRPRYYNRGCCFCGISGSPVWQPHASKQIVFSCLSLRCRALLPQISRFGAWQQPIPCGAKAQEAAVSTVLPLHHHLAASTSHLASDPRACRYTTLPCELEVDLAVLSLSDCDMGRVQDTHRAAICHQRRV